MQFTEAAATEPHQVVICQHPAHAKGQGQSDCKRQALGHRHHLQISDDNE